MVAGSGQGSVGVESENRHSCNDSVLPRSHSAAHGSKDRAAE